MSRMRGTSQARRDNTDHTKERSYLRMSYPKQRTKYVRMTPSDTNPPSKRTREPISQYHSTWEERSSIEENSSHRADKRDRFYN